MIPVILSGGFGSRLWPLSRTHRPKQFLELVGDQTLFQATISRLSSLIADLKPIIVANQDHRFLVADQCKQIAVKPKGILLEPIAKSTAPAILAAALFARTRETDPLLLVLPSDHVFSDQAAFEQAIRDGIKAAEGGQLVTFGIFPQSPEVGYGYIRAQADENGDIPRKVVDFVEKPNAVTAQEYLRSGEYFWNSGMFLFRASAFISEIQRLNPEMYQAVENSMQYAKTDLGFIRLDEKSYAASPADSVDYAVMEKTKNAVLVPMDAGWNDVGAWSAVWQVRKRDANHNAAFGDVVLRDSHQCLVHAEHRLVTLLGVENLVVIETADAVMVASQDQSQKVKNLVEDLKTKARQEVENHREVTRPWGAYDLIDQGPGYQVKRISVKPGERLSLQLHHHRAEHWVVVAGIAKVRLGDEERLLKANQSIYIPAKEKHFLENPGPDLLELIEVQTGSYLGEDDIVRFEDRYGRVDPSGATEADRSKT
jgi:mannose-1-phosphate guanylyltransferase/mannose-6-phosphate isomerase